MRVPAVTRGHRLAGERGEGGEEIDLRGDRGGNAGRDFPRPGNDHRHAGAAFEFGILAAAERTGRSVVAVFLDGIIFVTIIQHRAVVAADDDDGVFQQLELLQLRDDRADVVVELGDDVTARTEAGFPDEAGAGTRGTCGSCRAKNRKNGLSFSFSMNSRALAVKWSPSSSSFHSAALPPVMKPMRLTPLVMVSLCWSIGAEFPLVGVLACRSVQSPIFCL